MHTYKLNIYAYIKIIYTYIYMHIYTNMYAYMFSYARAISSDIFKYRGVFFCPSHPGVRQK